MSGFQQKEMEFLSRQAWDISAHLISIRYITLEPLQKELKGNHVLKRHSEKMLGKKRIMLLNKCHHLNATQTVQRQLFKTRSECTSAITWQEEARKVSDSYCLFQKKKSRDHFWKHREILICFCIQQNNIVIHILLYSCFGSSVSKDANIEILQKTLIPFCQVQVHLGQIH